MPPSRCATSRCPATRRARRSSPPTRPGACAKPRGFSGPTIRAGRRRWSLTRHLNRITSARVASEPWPFLDNAAAEVEVRIEDMLARADGTFVLSGQYFVTAETGPRPCASLRSQRADRARAHPRGSGHRPRAGSCAIWPRPARAAISAPARTCARPTAARYARRARGRGWCRNAPGSISRNATARQSRRPAPR